MVEKTERARVGDHPRSDRETEWEVFVRDDTDGLLRHVGSITAPDVDVAYGQATKLFAWYADDLWLCPAAAVHRFSTHDLDRAAEPTVIETDEEPRTVEE